MHTFHLMDDSPSGDFLQGAGLASFLGAAPGWSAADHCSTQPSDL